MENLDQGIRCLFFEKNLKICRPYGQSGFKTMYMVNGLMFCNIQYALVARNNTLLDNAYRRIHVYVRYQLANWTYTSIIVLNKDGAVTLGTWETPVRTNQMRGLFPFVGDEQHFVTCLETVLSIVEVDDDDENHFKAVYHLARLTGVLMTPYIFHCLLSKRKK
jgi:hypothetical protein